MAEDDNPDVTATNSRRATLKTLRMATRQAIFDTVVRIDFPPDEEDGRRYNHIIDIPSGGDGHRG